MAVEAIYEAWDHGRAVAVLDPTASAAAIRTQLNLLAPTHRVDATGRSPLPNGMLCSEGTCAVVFTSGTTGIPKMVELSAQARDAAASAVNTELNVTTDDSWLLTLHPGTVAGLAILARARASHAKVIVHHQFDPEAVMRTSATLTSMVPTQLLRCEPYGPPPFRAVLAGGGPALGPLPEGWPIHLTYGMSETWGGVIHDGYPLPGVHVRTDADGVIELRTPTVCNGYRGASPDTSSPFTADGWFRTSDIGHIATDGRLTVLGRVDDVINTGGHKVHPLTVEAAIQAVYPDMEVAIFGQADPEWGQRVVAVIVPPKNAKAPTLQDLRDHLPLERYQLPTELQIATGLPRSEHGKLLRSQLSMQFGCKE